MRIVCLLPAILMFSGCNEPVQTPVKFTLPERKVDPTSIKTVRLIVNEDYGDAAKFEGLPVGDDMAKLLSIFGLKALRDVADLPPSFEYTDATMVVDVKGTPLGQYYYPNGRPPAVFSFNCAKVEIEVRMAAEGKTIAFFKDQTREEPRAPNFTYEITRTPDGAPFRMAYPKEELLTKGLIILYRMLKREDIETVIDTLIDDDSTFEKAAYKALGQIHPNWRRDEELTRRTLPQFLVILREDARRHPFTLGNSTTRAIAAIGRPAMEELISLLEDEDAVFRRGIILSLREMRDPRAIEPLIARLEDEDDNDCAHYALLAITGQRFGRDPDKWLAWWNRNKQSLLRGR